MGLSTQVAARDRQNASMYPFPLTPLLGSLNLVSASIISLIMGDFIFELVGENMTVPSEILVTFVAAALTVIQQIVSFLLARCWTSRAKVNMFIHLALSVLWIAAFSLLTLRLGGMVLSHSCSLGVWQTDMGLMVCRLYKVVYSFSAVCVATAIAGAALDWVVLRNTTVGVYKPLGDQSSDMLKTVSVTTTPLMDSEREREHYQDSHPEAQTRLLEPTAHVQLKT